MGRFWSLLFLMVPVLGVGFYVAAAMPNSAPLYDHWLPLNVNEHGGVIDMLYMFILYLTGAIFIGTGLVLFWLLWKYDAEKNPEPVKFTHGSHALEVVWSILPAAILLFIAIFQMDAWADARMRHPTIITADGHEERMPATVEVMARQFTWQFRYPGEDGMLGTPDDIHTGEVMHLPIDEDIVVSLQSGDVLHSFFLPHLRIKLDVVPGMQQYIWFHANQPGTFDIVCAELCGWGHYKMRGRLVLQSREEFDEWLQQKWEEQELSEFEPGGGSR